MHVYPPITATINIFLAYSTPNTFFVHLHYFLCIYFTNFVVHTSLYSLYSVCTIKFVYIVFDYFLSIFYTTFFVHSIYARPNFCVLLTISFTYFTHNVFRLFYTKFLPAFHIRRFLGFSHNFLLAFYPRHILRIPHQIFPPSLTR